MLIEVKETPPEPVENPGEKNCKGDWVGAGCKSNLGIHAFWRNY